MTIREAPKELSGETPEPRPMAVVGVAFGQVARVVKP